MRRMLHILKWLGLTLSTLLLAAIFVLWVRSVGHWEGWGFERCEHPPDWTSPDLAGRGIGREWYAGMSHGRLWLGSRTRASWPEFKPHTQYWRNPISADQEKKGFDSTFEPGEQRWGDGIQRAWRFAGAGFNHIRDAVDPRLGRPKYESFDFAIPFWMLAVVFGLWPVGFVAWRLLRKKRHAPGHCPHCGYDLRATPDPAGPRLPRCPECGRHSPEREVAVAAPGS